MRFYVPEWEDHVDAEYDFVNDEHSTLAREDRNLAYIWDIFNRDPDRTPIDGVLISREQIEDSPSRARRLKEYGVYDAPNDGTTLAVPEWLPTISDCGAWGYKELPFPPYGNEEMLRFYEKLNVDIGVTIDHLVLGSGHASRLYIDERAFDDQFTADDLPEGLNATVNVMIDEWPSNWPEYVTEYEPSITDTEGQEPLRASDFDIDLDGLDTEDDRTIIEQRVKSHLQDMEDDPRIVYREDDMQFRYELTIDNLQEMSELYDADEYSFRLMCAVQGWDTSSYANATRAALSEGYQYLGIGGVAGSPEDDVKKSVAAVGEVIKDYERAHNTRVDTHVFGFAKTDAFDTIGRSGMTSFDSASMLRAAWTGGQNYHIHDGDTEDRYDALRVRFPNYQGPLTNAIDTALWSQETLHALRAYDESRSIPSAIRDWQDSATQPLDSVETYLEEHRWDERYSSHRITDLLQEFRSHFEYGRELKGNFSNRFGKRIIKLLRDDSADSPVAFEEYEELIEQARNRLKEFPRTISKIEEEVSPSASEDSFEYIWPVIESYAEWIGDEEHLSEYRRLLQERPWDDCGCEVCTDIGIDVAVFRGNNRNRRRGFHNTRNFYDQLEEELPKILLVTKGDSSLSTVETIEDFLVSNRTEFWKSVHDLPVAEIGVATAHGVHEWWEEPPMSLSFDPQRIADNIATRCVRYQDIFIDGANWSVPAAVQEKIEANDCKVHVIEDSTDLRQAVLDRLEYDERTIPPHPHRDEVNQVGISDFHS